MAEEQPTKLGSNRMEDDFKRFADERNALIKAELEAEKNYDTLLVTLSTLAIGSSFTVTKDVVKSTGVTATLVLAWSFFGICLLSSLTDKLLTYQTHKQWRATLDAEFSSWSEDVWERALAKFPSGPVAKLLPWLKWIGFGSLLVGLVLLLTFVAVGIGTPAPAAPTPPVPSPVVVNVYYSAPPTTMPTTQPTTRSLP